MAVGTRRSGFTCVRVCLDCGERIGEGDRCACPGQHPFVRGASVAVCHDEARERPLSLARVGRVGNGAFRLEGTKDWYDLDGRAVAGKGEHLAGCDKPTCPGGRACGHHGSGHFVRPALPGDEELLAARAASRRMLVDLESWEREVEECEARASSYEREVPAKLRDARGYDSLAQKVDVAALAEAARVKAEGEALELRRLHAAKAAELRAAAERYGNDARMNRERAAALRGKLDALPVEVQAVRLLGDRETLRAYLMAPSWEYGGGAVSPGGASPMQGPGRG